MITEAARRHNRTYHAKHRERRNTYSAAWRQAHPGYAAAQKNGVRSAMSMMKLEAGCADCGYSTRPEALDFDHLDPASKRLTIGAHSAHSLERLMAEAEKCDVVCANCHRIRTADRGYRA